MIRERHYTIVWTLLLVFTSFTSGNVMAQVDLYVDPGHGGVPSDSGADPGSPTPIDGLFEKDINLMVGLELKHIFDDLYAGYWNIRYSRIIDMVVLRTTRAYEADSMEARSFISIHHNSADPCPSEQHTIVLYSELPECDGPGNPWLGHAQDTSSILARKLG